jgi:uncharacterized membrane protein YbhN (UPF0104 family)
MEGTDGERRALVHRVQRGVRFVVLAATTWVIILGIAAVVAGDRSAWARLERAGPEIATMTLAAFIANHLIRFVRWQWMLRIVDARVPLFESLSIFLAGLGLLPTPGKIGVAVRSVLLMKYGVPVRRSLAAYFAERFFDLAGLLILAALFYTGPLSEGVTVVAMLGVIGMVLLVRYPEPVVNTLLHSARRWPRLALAVNATAGLLDAAKRLLAFPQAALLVVLGLLANALVGLLVYGVAMYLTTPVPVASGIGAVAFAHLSGSASMTPGGLGGFELALLFDLQHSSVPRDDALIIVTCVRFTTLWGSVAVGLPLMLIGLRRYPRATQSIGSS